MESCPVSDVAQLLGKKWTLPLLQQIHLYGGKGFNELMRQMKKISPKILTERLRALEDLEIIKKEVPEQDQSKTAYSITSKGKELEVVLAQFRAWNQKYNHNIPDCMEKECILCERY